MSLYLLVEGEKTEPKLYSRWLPQLVPGIAQIRRLQEAGGNSFYLSRGNGYPQTLDEVGRASENMAVYPGFRFLAVALDAEENTVAERIDEIEAYANHAALAAANCQLRVIVQNRCIETWLLGNRKFVTPDPNTAELGEWLRHYNVRDCCPETMPIRAGYQNHAETHGEYLKWAFREKRLAYSKREPGHASEPAYLSELQARTDLFPAHLPTFRTFLQLCAELRNAIPAPGDPAAR